jgi:triosephosphate isomerase (TIM)
MKFFAANWKMNKNPRQTRDFISQLKLAHSPHPQKKLVLFPSSFSLEAAANALDGSDVEFGAQNCYHQSHGAFTGENSPQVLKDMGGQWVLIGHSERRTLFAENDELLAKKLKFVHSLDLMPLLCIGETLEERESGQTNEVLQRQLRVALAAADKTKDLVVAYEPVWAIGTGKVASTGQVGEAHAFIFQTLAGLGCKASTAILYGGSVKAENAGELGRIPHVDGFLIGGASLEVKSYLDIFKAV